jgi:IclR family acetate operon transcriptional repressor
MRALDRSLRLLELLAEDGTGTGVSRLAQETGEAASTVHRLLKALAAHQLVVQDTATKKYRLGPGVLTLSDAYLRQSSLVAVARRGLEEIRDQTRESAFLTELTAGGAICVATAESPRSLRFFMSVGQRMPFHAAASARAILAFQPDTVIDATLRSEQLTPYTATTPRTVAEVKAELDRVREQGYDVCDQQMETGVTAVAVPIVGASRKVEASLSIVAPDQRLSGDRRSEMVHLLQAQARDIERMLNGAPVTRVSQSS